MIPKAGQLDTILTAPRTIRFRVVTLVALIVLPLILLFVWVAYQYADAKREIIELQRAELTRRISASIDKEIAIPLGMIVGLAGAHDLGSGAIDEFEKQALKQATQAPVLRIWAFNASGRPIVKTSERSDPTLALDDQSLARLRSGKPAVSPVRGTGTENATSIIAVPVRKNGRMTHGVAAEIKVAYLTHVLNEAPLGRDWVAAIVDRNNIFVARSLDTERRIGTAARPELEIAASGPETSGVFENVTYEGVHMIDDFHRSALTGWATVVAVPSKELAAPLKRAIALVFLGGSGVLLITLGFASLLSAQIAAPVRNLSAYAAALAGGQPTPPATTAIIELEEVRVALEQAMAQSARLSAIVASSGNAIMSMDLEIRVQTWNKGAEDLLQYTAEEIIGQPKSILIPDDLMTEFRGQVTAVLAGGLVRTETVRRRRDGTLVPVLLDSAPIRRPDGKIIAISTIMRDITESKAAEEHAHFLMRELAHRSKNQLAIIQSIAAQTARRATSIDQFLETLRQRLQGLAASHDLVVSQDWKAVPLERLVHHQMALFQDNRTQRFNVSGPEVRLAASAAEAIGLALHELATNSVKYGALSVPTGRIAITWSRIVNGTDGRLRLEWIETGGPAVEAPTTKGFGTQVTEFLVARAVNGVAAADYRANGFRWSLEFAPQA